MDNKQPTRSDTAALPDYLVAEEEEAVATYSTTPRLSPQAKAERRAVADRWKQSAEADHLPDYANEDEAAQYYPPKQATARQRHVSERVFLLLGILFALGIIVATLLAIPDIFNPHF